MKLKSRISILIILITFIIPIPPASAATRHVPVDHPTIQSCIDAATNGDECVVAPGTYNELINFLGKAITVRSSHGPDVTIIDGTGLNGSVVTFIRSQWFPTLGGLTITGGTGTGVGFTKGGGVFNDNYNPKVTNCIFKENAAWYGGGFYSGSGYAPKLLNCVFIKNTASYGGGGMYNEVSNPTLTDCTFIENTVSSTFKGGGMFNQSGAARIANCKFFANEASWGGGMYNQFGSVSLINSTFVGSEVGNSDCTLSITNCTFSVNSRVTFAGVSNYAMITGSIFWPDGFNYFLPFEYQIHFYFNIIPYLPYKADNGTNVVHDPMFVRSPFPGSDGVWDGVADDFGDLRLQPGSPCINAGDPNYVPPQDETDLDGHARVLCGRIDMGAYEFGVGDYDCDQAMTLTDVAAMQTCFTGDSGEPYSAGCESLDFELDGDVDALDLTTFSEILTDP